MKPALFVDRDGVLIENVPNYVRSFSEVEWFDFAFEAIRRARAAGFVPVVITNQAVIGRGLVPEDAIREIHHNIELKFEEEGAPIERSYLCPHKPEDDCECRKPKPGNLFVASRELGLDLARSYFIGDAMTDLQAARAAGVKGALVLTGRGVEESQKLEADAKEPVFDTLLQAVEWILGECK